MIVFTTGQRREMTPAHAYAATNDFALILDEITKGNLPVGTGKPFPVNFDDEKETPKSFSSPWDPAMIGSGR